MIARLAWPESPLAGRHVRLVPLSIEHLDALVEAAQVDRSTYAFTSVPEGRDAMRHYIEIAVALGKEGISCPFATTEAETGKVLGSTRFANLEHVQSPAPDGRAELVRAAAVEIGWTWLTPSAQRTAINSEAKLLMLEHAFEVWGIQHVVLKTNELNARSRAAIQRLGAELDGVVTAHLPGGIVRKAALYTLTREAWPRTREKLRGAIATPGPAAR